MWGDPERALKFDTPLPSDGSRSSNHDTSTNMIVEDPLMIYLYQMTGPLHIPYTDPIWLEVLHGYNVWVHVTIQQHPTTTSTTLQNSTSTPKTSNRNDHHHHHHPPSSSHFTTPTTITMMEVACQRMVQYSIHTSNMATFTMHLIRLIQEYILQIQPQQQQQQQQSKRNGKTNHSNTTTTTTTSTAIIHENTGITTNHRQQHHPRTYPKNPNISPKHSNPNPDDTIMEFSNRIAIVEKARALAGVLNLYRIFLHTILSSISDRNNSSHSISSHDSHTTDDNDNTNHDNDDTILEQILTYSSRETDAPPQQQQPTNVAIDLLNAVLQLICCSRYDPHLQNDRDVNHHYHDQHHDAPAEVYDCHTLALQLLVVLLSTQLYQPLCSSFQRYQSLSNGHTMKNPTKKKNIITQTTTTTPLNFWNLLLQEANRGMDFNNNTNNNDHHTTWSARQLLHILLHWSMERPPAPNASIQSHHCQMVQHLITIPSHDHNNNHHQKHKIGPDLMYEDYYIVHAMAPNIGKGSSSSNSGSNTTSDDPSLLHRPDSLTLRSTSGRSLALLDATKGVIAYSSKLILFLPFRLMSLALSLWGLQDPNRKLLLGGGGYGRNQQQQSYTKDQLRQIQLRNRQHNKNKRRTRDVLWLSMSPLGDLSTSILLLLTNNERHSDCKNVFRTEMITLSDNRWGDNIQEQHHYDLPDLPDTTHTSSLLTNHSTNEAFTTDSSFRSHEGMLTPEQKLRLPNGVSNNDTSSTTPLMINFEGLFASFGRTAHTEPGALWLYTLLQLSPSFTSAIAVRSDLDTIVLPLLRTLYYSTSMQYHIAQDYQSKGKKTPNSRQDVTTAQDHPYRSQSQLYVIIILLLLFSQDSSFGSDAFRRVTVPIVPWYKERYLKDVRLGSVLVLVLLRSLTFNLTRQHDAFLLTNCCAVLMNLSSSMVDLYDYTAMKFVSTTIAFMKRYMILHQQNPDNNEDDITTPTSMYGEASRTLLCVLKHCLDGKNIEKNLHLVYALVYHHADFVRIFGSKDCPFAKSEMKLIQKVTTEAIRIIDQDGNNARTAQKALKALSDHIHQLIDVVKESSTNGRSIKSMDYQSTEDDFTFTYEEEADPEIFFVPYVWEVIVCVITSATMEWEKSRIKVFPLLDVDDDTAEHDVALDDDDDDDDNSEAQSMIPHFARDVTDVVLF